MKLNVFHKSDSLKLKFRLLLVLIHILDAVTNALATCVSIKIAV